MSVALTVQGRHDALVVGRREDRSAQDGTPSKPPAAPPFEPRRTSASEGFAAQLSQQGLAGPEGKTAAAQEPADADRAANRDDAATAADATARMPTSPEQSSAPSSRPNLDALNRVLAHYKAQSEAASFAVSLVM